jgi:lysophospholipid acyltransferase (LPLAT)-like uncharacterized protein
VQPGVIWLAGATGNPILPFHIESSSYWTVNSWDKHQVPKPGSHVAIAIGNPIEVAATDEATVESTRAVLEAILGALEIQAKSMVDASC